MPGGDGTGPDGTYQNCTPTGNTPMYGRRGRGRGNRRGTPGMGGRGRGYMNRFNATGQPGYRRNYQPNGLETEMYKERQTLLSKLVKTLDLIVERLEKKYARPAYRVRRIQQQLDELRKLKRSVDPAMRKEIERAITRFNIRKLKTQAQRRTAAAQLVAEISGVQSEVAQLRKKTMIRKARTQTERRERADELVHDIVDYRTQKDDRIQTKPGVDPEADRPTLAT